VGWHGRSRSACANSLGASGTRIARTSVVESHPTERDLGYLNSFLRGELSAVETYTQCINELFVSRPKVVDELRELRASHLKRVQLLSERIETLGGQPAQDSSAWGALARLVEGGAKLFGPSAAIATLEAGEEHGRAGYAHDMWHLTPDTKAFIQSIILPEQQRTRRAVQALKRCV
jgi:hypothetical protein